MHLKAANTVTQLSQIREFLVLEFVIIIKMQIRYICRNFIQHTRSSTELNTSTNFGFLDKYIGFCNVGIYSKEKSFDTNTV